MRSIFIWINILTPNIVLTILPAGIMFRLFWDIPYACNRFEEILMWFVVFILVIVYMQTAIPKYEKLNILKKENKEE